jgi:hypothetical protein
MWIFTKHGFFSAVCARKGDGMHGEPVDPERIMVRSRIRGHLEAFSTDRLFRFHNAQNPL